MVFGIERCLRQCNMLGRPALIEEMLDDAKQDAIDMQLRLGSRLSSPPLASVLGFAATVLNDSVFVRWHKSRSFVAPDC